MKTYRYISYCLLLLLINNSCNSDSTLSKEFPKEQSLTAEQITVSRLLNPLDMEMHNEFLVMANDQIDTCFYSISMKDTSCWKQHGIIGQGPEDFISPTLIRSNTENVYVKGYNDPDKLQQFSLSPDGTMQAKESFKVNFGDKIPNQLHVINDSVLLYNDFVSGRMALVQYDLKQNKNLRELEFEKVPLENQFLQDNRGILSANAKTIAYGYALQNKIDFYNHDLKKIASVLVADDINKEHKDMNKAKNYYMNLVAGKDKFYALCASGKTFADIMSQANPYTLEVFNNEGKPVIKYTLDICPLFMAIDEENNILYGYTPEKPDILLKYKL